MSKTCFVVMAIGKQHVGTNIVDEAKLKEIYENLIRPAILLADSTLDVKRADEVEAQGTVTTDILTRLMHNDLVVVDITYPNPNVFYELGVRHACRTGTIIIRDKSAPALAPFDVGHQRYISYEEKLGGEKALAAQLHERMEWYKLNPVTPDNHLLEHAKNSKYNFPQYGQEIAQQRQEGIGELVRAIVGSEAIMATLLEFVEQQGNAPPMVKELITAARQDPSAVVGIVSGLIKAGVIDPAKLLNR